MSAAQISSGIQGPLGLRLGLHSPLPWVTPSKQMKSLCANYSSQGLINTRGGSMAPFPTPGLDQPCPASRSAYEQ